MSRVATLLALLAAVACGWLGLRQASSYVLREEEPAAYWPRGNTRVVRGWVPGHGLRVYSGRSEYSGFAGGGPGGYGK